MFDISLGELAVIGAVALVVIGPEKLPKVARTAGMLFGRAQRMAANLRADLEREFNNAELADLKQKITNEAASFKDEMTDSAAAVSQALAEPENRILPQVPVPESVPALPQEMAEIPSSKPVRRRRKAVESAAESAPEPAIEGQTEAAPVKIAPRKRKAAEPQRDLFAAPGAAMPTERGDRR